MVMRSNDRAIDIMNRPVALTLGIGWLLHGIKEALPDAGIAPSIEAADHRAPGDITFGQVAPGSAGTPHPQHAVEDAAIIRSGSTRLKFFEEEAAVGAASIACS